MQHFGVAITSLAITASADLLNYSKHFRNSNATERASLTQYNELMSALNGYGCWCYLGAHGTGEKGQSQDQFDDLCKLLHKGYDCIVMADATCEPWTIDYAGSTAPDVTELRDNCKLLNPTDSCKEQACIVEGYFYSSYTELLTSEGGLFGSFHHVDDAFDTSICPLAIASVGGDRQCCGVYPFRKPYRDGATTACCEDITRYNSATKVCCSDGAGTVALDNASC